MTLTDIFVFVWLGAGAASLFYTLRKLRKARRDYLAHAADGMNGQVLFAVRWRLRAAWKSIAIAALIASSAMLALLDRLVEGPPMFGLTILMLLTGIPLVFVWKQIDDDRSSDRLVAIMIAALTDNRPAGSEKRRAGDSA
ncbi:MAG TPA: hypothetical protein VGR85_03095 [Candidatus Limnocylindria bacterium]|nr:hypothetical protein [Candidatus Limnocylindria bacterium]